jgi:ABC-type bacteriocin/lantibiotic exporter with double-glycine peptidase domain
VAQTIPPFYPQETDFSCAVACLRMVLAAAGFHRSEAELREMCDCTIFGTTALSLVQTARSLGFDYSRKHTLTLTDVEELTQQGHFPIVYVLLEPKSLKPDVHSLVVVSITESEIGALDPKQGAVMLPTEEFLEMWSSMKNLAIVIARSSKPQTQITSG